MSAEADTVHPLLARLQEAFPAAVVATHCYRGDPTATVRREAIVEVCRFVRDDEALAFDLLVDVTAVDYMGQPAFFAAPEEPWDSAGGPSPRQARLRSEIAVPPRGPEPRFEVVYHLLSTRHGHRLRLKARVPEEDPTIASVTGVWVGANWLERETYDLYGIRFRGHPDLRRIYLDESFVGHPLRKDYPKRGEQPLVPYVLPFDVQPRRPR